MGRLWMTFVSGLLLQGCIAESAYAQDSRQPGLTEADIQTSWDTIHSGTFQSSMEALLGSSSYQSGGAAVGQALAAAYPDNCGDGACVPGETHVTCPSDCPQTGLEDVIDGVVDGLTNLTFPLGPLVVPTRSCTCIAEFLNGARQVLESTVLDQGDDTCAQLESQLPLQQPELLFAKSIICADTPLELKFDLKRVPSRPSDFAY